MKVVILAAGLGKRMGSIGQVLPKCMLEIDGETLIGRLLRQISAYHIQEVCIVVGHCADVLKEHIALLQRKIRLPNISFISNDKYNYANNIYSLYVARDFLNSDSFLFEADLILEDSILWNIFTSDKENFALVSPYRTWMDGSMVAICGNTIKSMVLGNQFNFKWRENYYKTVNVYRFSKAFLKDKYIPLIEKYIQTDNIMCYYETALVELIDSGYMLEVEVLEDWQKWYEIDNINDLRIAKTLFSSGMEQHKNLEKYYGGYWRFDIKDYYYLVNPYFPSDNLLREMRHMNDKLLTSYPSSLDVNRELAANLIGIDKRFLSIGNGATELIALLMRCISGTLGVILPTFEEYKNRYQGKIKGFVTDDFTYDAKSIVKFLKGDNIEVLVMMAPDNPSGFCIKQKEVLEILEYAYRNDILIIFDESFMDFASNPYSFLRSDILLEYPNLVVIKSLSKSYGVAGIRLGVLATSNKKLLNNVINQCPIWNINAFGEYFMQSMPKYKRDYKKACESLKEARKNMMLELKKFNELYIYLSESNYFLCEIVDDSITIESFIEWCLDKGFFLKDCQNKIGIDGRKFLRIAIRRDEDNKALVQTIREFLLHHKKKEVNESLITQ